MQEKSTLRKRLLGQRSRLDSQAILQASEAITARCIDLIGWEKLQSVHIYIPIADKKEVDSRPLIKYILENQPHINIFTPTKSGAALITAESKLEVSNYGFFDSPDAIFDHQSYEVVFVPMLGFDENGHRLGYGKGYYDQFLAMHPSAKTLGLAYSFSELDKIPNEPHDVALNQIVTEKKIFEFR